MTTYRSRPGNGGAENPQASPDRDSAGRLLPPHVAQQQTILLDDGATGSTTTGAVSLPFGVLPSTTPAPTPVQPAAPAAPEKPSGGSKPWEFPAHLVGYTDNPPAVSATARVPGPNPAPAVGAPPPPVPTYVNPHPTGAYQAVPAVPPAPAPPPAPPAPPAPPVAPAPVAPRPMAPAPAAPAPVAGLKKPRSSLSGGRWRRSLVLVLMLVTMGVLVLNGLYRLADKALYTPPAAPPGASYPSDAASGYAAHFASAYLDWDENHPDQRASALDQFFPGAQDGLLGWDGKGVQRVLGQPVTAGVHATDAHHGVVSIATDLDPGGWTCMQVAVYAGGDNQFAIMSYTAFVSCPRAANPSIAPETRDSDDQLTSQLRPVVEAFLTSYAASDTGLEQLTTSGSHISGLGGEVQFGQLAQLFVPVVAHGEDPSKRIVTVEVQWLTISGGSITQQYQLSMVQISNRWFVSSISGGVPAPVSPDGSTPDELTTGSPTPSGSTSGSPGPSGSVSPSPSRTR